MGIYNGQTNSENETEKSIEVVVSFSSWTGQVQVDNNDYCIWKNVTIANEEYFDHIFYVDNLRLLFYLFGSRW